MTYSLRLTRFLTKTTWWILFTSLNKLDTTEYPANTACVWLNMYLCTWSAWSTSCGASCGVSVDQEIMANYLHHWFMNKWKKNDFPLLHSADKLCESSCKQSVSDTSAARKHKQSIMYYIHSINNQMIRSVLWLRGYSAPALPAVSHLYTNTHSNQKHTGTHTRTHTLTQSQ